MRVTYSSRFADGEGKERGRGRIHFLRLLHCHAIQLAEEEL